MQTDGGNIMREMLQNSGWVNYRTGCSCVGLPRYWRNNERPGVEVVTKGDSFFRILENGNEQFSGVRKDFETKMKEYNLI